MLTPQRSIDHYLVALATARGERLATSDRGIQIEPVSAARPLNLLVLAVESD